MKRFIVIVQHNSEQSLPILVEVNNFGNITNAVWGHYTSADYVREGEVKTAAELAAMSDRYGGSPWCQDAPEWVGRTLSDLQALARIRRREHELKVAVFWDDEIGQYVTEEHERWKLEVMRCRIFNSHREAQAAIDNKEFSDL